MYTKQEEVMYVQVSEHSWSDHVRWVSRGLCVVQNTLRLVLCGVVLFCFVFCCMCCGVLGVSYFALLFCVGCVILYCLSKANHWVSSCMTHSGLLWEEPYIEELIERRETLKLYFARGSSLLISQVVQNSLTEPCKCCMMVHFTKPCPHSIFVIHIFCVKYMASILMTHGYTMYKQPTAPSLPTTSSARSAPEVWNNLYITCHIHYTSVYTHRGTKAGDAGPAAARPKLTLLSKYS